MHRYSFCATATYPWIPGPLADCLPGGLLLAIGLSTGGLAGQSSISVGPRGQFTSLQRAVDAARPGDVLSVDPGRYGPLVIDSKGVHIVGSRPGRIVLRGEGSTPLTVHGVPQGQTCIVEDVHVDWVDEHTAAVSIHDNVGGVALFDCTVQPSASVPLHGARIPGAVWVERNPNLWLADLHVDPERWGFGHMQNPLPGLPEHDGIAALYAVDSTIRLDRPRLHGLYGTGPGGRGGAALLGAGQLRVFATALGDSSAGQLIGGDSGAVGGDAVHLLGGERAYFERTGPLPLLPGGGPLGAGAVFARDGDGGEVVLGGNGGSGGGGLVINRIVPSAPAAVSGGVRHLESDALLGSTCTLRVRCGLPRDYAVLIAPGIAVDFGAVRGQPALLDFTRAVPLLFGRSRGSAFPADHELPLPAAPQLLGVCLGVQVLMGPGPSVGGLVLGGGDLLTLQG